MVKDARPRRSCRKDSVRTNAGPEGPDALDASDASEGGDCNGFDASDASEDLEERPPKRRRGRKGKIKKAGQTETKGGSSRKRGHTKSSLVSPVPATTPVEASLSTFASVLMEA